jgi:hypothetical protein
MVMGRNARCAHRVRPPPSGNKGAGSAWPGSAFHRTCRHRYGRSAPSRDPRDHRRAVCGASSGAGPGHRAHGREAALAQPLSPGAVALLAPYANHPTVIARALIDGRPEVRAVAARLAFATGQRTLAETVVTALEAEQDPRVGAEIVRALALQPRVRHSRLSRPPERVETAAAGHDRGVSFAGRGLPPLGAGIRRVAAF